MVSWGRAFKGAAGIVGFAIIWWFVGGLIMGAGLLLSGMGFGTFSFSTAASLMSLVLGVILMLIGSIVGILGTLAAFVKILPEIVAEEVRSK